MLDTHVPPPGSTRDTLFGPPALQRSRPRPSTVQPAFSLAVSATATGSFKMDRCPRVVEVDVMVEGVVFTCLVRGLRVVGPARRGAKAVRFTEPSVAAEVHRAAVEAAQTAARRGWV